MHETNVRSEKDSGCTIKQTALRLIENRLKSDSTSLIEGHSGIIRQEVNFFVVPLKFFIIR